MHRADISVLLSGRYVEVVLHLHQGHDYQHQQARAVELGPLFVGEMHKGTHSTTLQLTK